MSFKLLNCHVNLSKFRSNRLATEAKVGSMLMESGELRKIEKIDDHLGMVLLFFCFNFFLSTYFLDFE